MPQVTFSIFLAGESNAEHPVRYARCFPAMIQQWRRDFVDASRMPFIFAQLSAWPDQNTGIVAGMRYAQQAALALSHVGMAVAADLGDPAGVFQPIHTPFKQELGRRAALVAESLVYGDNTVSLHGPRVVNVTWCRPTHAH